jgi:hypothetical protein
VKKKRGPKKIHAGNWKRGHVPKGAVLFQAGVRNSPATEFKPGQSGNAGGRPKKRPITERYQLIAESPLPESERRKMHLWKGATWGDAAAIGTFLAAIEGQHSAAKEIREAIEGKAPQRIEVVGGSGGPVRISLDETVERIREFYGLSKPTTTPRKPADLEPLPA